MSNPLSKFVMGSSLLVLAGCFPYPNVTLTDTPRPPIEVGAVSVVLAETVECQALGQGYAWSPLPLDTQKGYNYALGILKQRAASVGANVVAVPALEQIEMQPRLRERYWWPPQETRHLFDGEVERPSEMMALLYFCSSSPR